MEGIMVTEPGVAPEAEGTVIPTPTPAVEDIASLQVKLTKLETELEQTKKGLSTAHQTLTQRDKELKNQSDLRGEIASIRDDLELAVTAFATRQEENPDNETVKGALAELAKKRDAREAGRRAQEAGNILTAYQQRVTALGLTEEDPEYWEIYRTARTLDPIDLKLADLRLKKLEALKVVKNEPPKEVEEERVKRLVKEQLAKDYPGLYASDAGGPSGSVQGSLEEGARDYALGAITEAEARKRGVIFS